MILFFEIWSTISAGVPVAAGAHGGVDGTQAALCAGDQSRVIQAERVGAQGAGAAGGHAGQRLRRHGCDAALHLCNRPPNVHQVCLQRRLLIRRILQYQQQGTAGPGQATFEG